MRCAVLGTGMVGRAIAGRLDDLGHDVLVGTRAPEATRARADQGDDAYSVWSAEHPAVGLKTFADAAAASDVVFNATSGLVSLEVLRLAGSDNLSGTVLVDISNPLDFSHGFPPTLFKSNTDSLGEEIQRSFPEAKVVKTLNTLNADLMVHPEALPEGTSVFVSGNDTDAKATVTSLLEQFGHTDVIDLGDITTARGAEMVLPLWLHLMGTLGTATFNFKIVR